MGSLVITFIMNTLYVLLFSFNIVSGLIRLDWETLSSEVTLRYFSYDKYFSSSDPQGIWDQMGENITCTVDQDMVVTVVPPSGFDAAKPIKLVTHGFIDTMINDNTQFVSAWMENFGEEYSVVLLGWQNLAWFAQISSWDDFIYDLAARNSIDVGEFTGLCLAGLSNSYGMSGDLVHLIGHSLGAHAVGKAGRTFQSAQQSQELVGRITGLDPAGPRFVDGPILPAIPELNEEIITPESSAFVDIIHSNGGFEPAAISPIPRLGAIQQLGHMDFYPDGGSVQSGCLFGIDALPGGACSHVRSLLYYLHSIREENLFPSSICYSVDSCNQEIMEDETVVAYMGESAMQNYQGGRQLLYHDVHDCHWTYWEHNSFLC